ncbi:hypothetical protein ACFY8O_14000 [Streptomyces argenteolus]|uniref:Uncharacterized protein n=1 Tax=Streptomyces argenteolus TaxID=67274 RepID=A0ABW6X7M8_9ACTN
MTTFTITVDGSDDDNRSLWDWLRQEPGLRGRVRRHTTPPAPGSMGSMVELVIEAVVGGTVGTIAGQLGPALSSWLARSRAGGPRDTTLTITLPEGGTVVLTADNAALAVRLLQSTPAVPLPGETGTADSAPRS